MKCFTAWWREIQRSHPVFLRKNKNLSILLTIKGHHLLTCWHVPQFFHTGACSSPLRGKTHSFRSQHFQPGARRTEHATADVLRQEAGQDSSAAPHQFAFSSSLFSLCPRPVAAILAWGGPSCSGPLPPPTSSDCILPSPWCNGQSRKLLISLASWRGGSQLGVRRCHRYNRVGQKFWAVLWAMVSPVDAPVWCDS